MPGQVVTHRCFSFHALSTSAFRKLTSSGAAESGVEARESGYENVARESCEVSDVSAAWPWPNVFWSVSLVSSGICGRGATGLVGPAGSVGMIGRQLPGFVYKRALGVV